MKKDICLNPFTDLKQFIHLYNAKNQKFLAFFFSFQSSSIRPLVAIFVLIKITAREFWNNHGNIFEDYNGADWFKDLLFFVDERQKTGVYITSVRSLDSIVIFQLTQIKNLNPSFSKESEKFLYAVSQHKKA